MILVLIACIASAIVLGLIFWSMDETMRAKNE